MKYKLIERGNPSDPAAAKKLYASPIISDKVSLKTLSAEIAGRSSLTSGDIANVISNLLDRLPVYLVSGNSIKLGDFGTFRLSFSSEGVEKQDDFSTSKIKGIKVVFTPGKDMKRQLTNIHFEKE
jgi:predicted histone-like DNA-binding protein